MVADSREGESRIGPWELRVLSQALRESVKEKLPLNTLSADNACGKVIAKLGHVSSANMFLEFDVSLLFRLIFLLKSSKSHPSC